MDWQKFRAGLQNASAGPPEPNGRTIGQEVAQGGDPSAVAKVKFGPWEHLQFWSISLRKSISFDPKIQFFGPATRALFRLAAGGKVCQKGAFRRSIWKFRRKRNSIAVALQKLMFLYVAAPPTLSLPPSLSL